MHVIMRQIDDAYVRSLDPEALRGLSVRLLADLKEARERLNQGPTNSSRPPSRRAPWARGEPPIPTDEAEEEAPVTAEPAEEPPAEVNPTAVQPVVVKPTGEKPARKAGKQPGAPGMGRTQVLEAREVIPHYPGSAPAAGGR